LCERTTSLWKKLKLVAREQRIFLDSISLVQSGDDIRTMGPAVRTGLRRRRRLTVKVKTSTFP
jgi:hypothetical protein